MSDFPTPLARSAPQDGDVIVTRESRSAVRYTVRQHPRERPVSATPRDEAIRLARSFAQKHLVDVWYTESGTHRLLEAYRPGLARDAEARGVTHHVLAIANVPSRTNNRVPTSCRNGMLRITAPITEAVHEEIQVGSER